MVREFTASEDNYYDVQFRNGPLMSEIYGAGWEKFVREYGLRSGDRVVVGLKFYGLHLPVEFIGVRNCDFHYHGLVSWFYSSLLIKIYFLIFQFFSQFDYC